VRISKCDDGKCSLYEELGCAFYQFLRYDVKVLLGDFNVKVGREDIFKLTIGNKSSHEISTDNGVKSSKLCHIEKPSCRKYNVSSFRHS
jgi:hypothetical protein